MGAPLDQGSFTGAHPTTAEFYQQLLAWGFTHRREDGVHLVLRGPHGRTIRILRSLTGRADADLVDKAARLAEITIEQFWAGPPATTDHVASTDTGEAADVDESGQGAHRSSRRRGKARDSVTSLVLAVHVKADRPLGFDEVVELCGGRVSRRQVCHASSTLCRDGDLDRVRTGVYQWPSPTATATASPPPAPYLVAFPPPARSSPRTHPEADRDSKAELFNQLFPNGVQMTGDMYADFQRWAELTEKLETQARAS